MDAHGSYVAMSRHRDGMDLHYGRDDFANPNRLARTLSRDRSKDMASDYEPAQAYAERRSISFRDRAAKIVRKIVPEQVRERIGGMFDGLRLPAASTDRATPDTGELKESEKERVLDADTEAALRKARTDALVRHARATDTIIEAKRLGLMPSAEQRRELGAARDAFDAVRPHGWQDAESAYSKDNSLAHEAGTGRIGRTVRALQLETEIRTGRDADTGVSPSSRANRFVERWQKLDQTSQRQYEDGDYSGYKSTRRAMGDMASSLKRDPQLESLLGNRKRELGISFDSGRHLGDEIAFHAGIDLGRGRGIGI